MKKALLHLIVVCVLATGTYAHAHWWRVNNFTSKTLLLKLKLFGSNNPYYAIVHPDESALFDWSAPNPMSGFCLDKLYWAEAPQELFREKTIIDKNHVVINNEAMENTLKKYYPHIRLTESRIEFITNKLYEKTVQLASSFGPKKLITWIAKKHAQSACKSRHMSVTEEPNGTLHFFTQKN